MHLCVSLSREGKARVPHRDINNRRCLQNTNRLRTSENKIRSGKIIDCDSKRRRRSGQSRGRETPRCFFFEAAIGQFLISIGDWFRCVKHFRLLEMFLTCVSVPRRDERNVKNRSEEREMRNQFAALECTFRGVIGSRFFRVGVSFSCLFPTSIGLRNGPRSFLCLFPTRSRAYYLRRDRSQKCHLNETRAS